MSSPLSMKFCDMFYTVIYGQWVTAESSTGQVHFTSKQIVLRPSQYQKLAAMLQKSIQCKSTKLFFGKLSKPCWSKQQVNIACPTPKKQHNTHKNSSNDT